MVEKSSNTDKRLKDALLKRALGYEYEEKQVIVGKNGKPDKMRVVKRHVPPDLKAIEIIRTLQRMGAWQE